MKKSLRNQKKTKEQKATARQRRQSERIRKRDEKAVKRNARIFMPVYSVKEKLMDAKLKAILTYRSYLQRISSQPLIVVLLGYNNLFGKTRETTFGNQIGEIPTLAAINYVIAHMDEVMYGQTDPQKLQKQILEMMSYLRYSEKKALYNLIARSDAVSIFNNAGCLRFIYLAMQNYHPMPQGDYELTAEDKRRVYKALTYCNQLVTDEQNQNIEVNRVNIVEAMMAIDMPMVEFKSYKYFLTQLVKGLRFFEYCQKPMLGDSPEAKAKQEEYQHYLEQFYQDMGVSDWIQYLKQLMLIIVNYVQNPNGRFVKIKDGEHSPFVQNMLLEPSAFQNKTYEEALKYMRNHFLWQVTADWDTQGKISDNTYLLINSNMLVDRLYMGVLFSFLQSMNKYRVQHKQNPISFVNYKATLGTDFAEPRLFYPIMSRVFRNARYRKMTGNELKESYNMDGTSDYYLQVGNKLMLFEFKDALLGDQFKYSHDVQLIKREILHRICNPGSSAHDDNRKGVYQLMDTVRDLDSTTKYNVVSLHIENIKVIYPIVVITDLAFGANGVNAIVTKEFNKTILPQYTFTHPFELRTPIVIHIDTLMNIAKRISDGFWRFEDMLDGYLRMISASEIATTSTFDGFVVDEYMHKYDVDEENATYIFGDDLKPLIDQE